MLMRVRRKRKRNAAARWRHWSAGCRRCICGCRCPADAWQFQIDGRTMLHTRRGESHPAGQGSQSTAANLLEASVVWLHVLFGDAQRKLCQVLVLIRVLALWRLLLHGAQHCASVIRSVVLRARRCEHRVTDAALGGAVLLSIRALRPGAEGWGSKRFARRDSSEPRSKIHHHEYERQTRRLREQCPQPAPKSPESTLYFQHPASSICSSGSGQWCQRSHPAPQRPPSRMDLLRPLPSPSTMSAALLLPLLRVTRPNSSRRHFSEVKLQSTRETNPQHQNKTRGRRKNELQPDRRDQRQDHRQAAQSQQLHQSTSPASFLPPSSVGAVDSSDTRLFDRLGCDATHRRMFESAGAAGGFVCDQTRGRRVSGAAIAAQAVHAQTRMDHGRICGSFVCSSTTSTPILPLFCLPRRLISLRVFGCTNGLGRFPVFESCSRTSIRFGQQSHGSSEGFNEPLGAFRCPSFVKTLVHEYAFSQPLTQDSLPRGLTSLTLSGAAQGCFARRAAALGLCAASSAATSCLSPGNCEKALFASMLAAAGRPLLVAADAAAEEEEEVVIASWACEFSGSADRSQGVGCVHARTAGLASQVAPCVQRCGAESNLLLVRGVQI